MVFHPISMAASFLAAVALVVPGAAAQEKEPGAVDPFGPRETAREDTAPGYLELSDGKVYPGQLFLTRDHRLSIFDTKQERHRQIPLHAIRRIDCKVTQEWMEKEWRFKENANDQKVFTGRAYPVREYVHVITLNTGRKIEGPLSGIIFVQSENNGSPERFLLHKRDKGDTGMELRSLLYVRSICLGASALEEAQRAAARNKPGKKKSE